ncbi:methenyltetrahydrofolate synthase domain-containing protein [Diorhabda carinulata]|uniref:methenyltetrahydrofolate synthase domain-containing protein n=1 Tax=Diorhabda carinulata TaxID=1163345 RepID=UPI0025A2C7CE|nr:methenyltetrahydrofolate synthase domain-containing protein [Diorhabda carinulata]
MKPNNSGSNMDKQVSRNEEIIPPVLADEETKLTIRKKVWECFSNHRLITFPKPHGRIPNFIGIEDTTMNLTKLPEFIGAKSVAVFIDKALTSARELVLENSKDLYVPFPRFQRCLMKKIVVNESDDFKTLVSRGDIHRGENVGISDGVTVDMLIVGSVAVSKEGYRIGRGRGFEDLEYGLFKEYKAVNDDTVIVTIVHDLQVFDSLPRDLFEKYDTPVDVIITPTRTIIVENKLPKPTGIFWNELNVGQVKSRKLLQILYAEHKKSQNRDTTLSKENGKGHRPFYWRRYSKKETKNPVDDPDANRIDQNDKENQKKKRRGSAKRNKGEDDTPRTEESYRTDETDRSKRNEKRRRNFRIDYSLKVTNINKKMRTRDFVKALKERNIKPRCITWKGKRGVCYLHYVKKDRKKDEDVSDAINDVIEIIQDLKLDPDEPDKNLNVKVVEPITRIETVDVTAV